MRLLSMTLAPYWTSLLNVACIKRNTEDGSYSCFFRHDQGIYYCSTVFLHKGYMRARIF